jgi:hypothetical protein
MSRAVHDFPNNAVCPASDFFYNLETFQDVRLDFIVLTHLYFNNMIIMLLALLITYRK